MAHAPISIKLRCASWQQLASIYKRDLVRSAIFLKSGNPPPLGTPVRIDLTLPSESMVVLTGVIAKHIGEGELEGRGPGIDVRLNAIPQSAMWLIETALASAQGKESKDAARKASQQPAPTETSAVASLGDGRDVADAETELLVALTSELESLKKLNPFQVLGLGYEAGDAEVRAAFGELTKRYHPDRYARFQSMELRNLAAEIFILIRDAYRRLGDEASRAQVLAGLARPPLRASTTDAARPPEARPPVPGGRAPTPPPIAVPPKPAPAAPRVSTVAVVPPAPAAPAPAAAPDASLAESMLDSGKYDEALAYYKILLKRAPGDRAVKAGIELAEGMRALAARDRLEAAQRFETVLELDPANERAARELAEMRRVATNERKGMLSRLLGKKE